MTWPGIFWSKTSAPPETREFSLWAIFAFCSADFFGTVRNKSTPEQQTIRNTRTWLAGPSCSFQVFGIVLTRRQETLSILFLTTKGFLGPYFSTKTAPRRRLPAVLVTSATRFAIVQFSNIRKIAVFSLLLWNQHFMWPSFALYHLHSTR